MKAGARRKRDPEGENLIERFEVELTADGWMGKESLDFRSKEKCLIRDRIEKRLDTHAIAGSKKLAVASIPDGECPLPIEFADALFALAGIEMKNDFCVGACGELMAFGDEFFTQFEVVENFTVVGDPE